MAKMSGRGLGFTGGTLDKLESIPGFRVELPIEDFKRQVREIGCAVVGQNADLAPADKVLYALRDVTGTVDCMPLIVSSILSKKLAAGCDVVVLDVKYGSGALAGDARQAKELAEFMVRLGSMSGREVLRPGYGHGAAPGGICGQRPGGGRGHSGAFRPGTGRFENR